MLKIEVEDHLARWLTEMVTLLIRISCTDLLLCLAFCHFFFFLCHHELVTILKLKTVTLKKSDISFCFFLSKHPGHFWKS